MQSRFKRLPVAARGRCRDHRRRRRWRSTGRRSDEHVGSRVDRGYEHFAGSRYPDATRPGDDDTWPR